MPPWKPLDEAAPGLAAGTARVLEASSGEWLIETVNVTTTKILKKRVASTSAHVLLVQEHGVLKAEVRDFEHWAHSQGWASLIAPAALSDKGTAHLGAMIMVKEPVGLAVLGGVGPELVDNRMVVGMVQFPGWPRMLCWVCLPGHFGSPLCCQPRHSGMLGQGCH